MSDGGGGARVATVTTPKPAEERPDDADSSSSNIISIALVGPSGVGKTTLIRTFISNTPWEPTSEEMADDDECEAVFVRRRRAGDDHDGSGGGADAQQARLTRCTTQINGACYTLNLLDCASLAPAACAHIDMARVDAFVVCFSADLADDSIAFARAFRGTEHAARPAAVVMAARLKADKHGAHEFLARTARATTRSGEYVDGCSARHVASVRSLFARTAACVFAARREQAARARAQQEPPTPVQQRRACKVEYKFKVVVLGEAATGKTALVKRLAHGAAPPYYRPTIGVDFDVVEHRADRYTSARVQLWDVSGQERFGTMTEVYCRQCAGALLVFDQAKKATYFALERWLDGLRAACAPDVPAVLVANKSDLGAAVTRDELQSFCAQHRLAGFVEACALTGRGVQQALDTLADAMVAFARAHRIAGTRTPLPADAAADGLAAQQREQPAEPQSAGPVLFTSWRM